MTPDAYPAPRTWDELFRIKVTMQRDLLSRAAKSASTQAERAASIDMEATNYINTCARLGVNPKTGEMA